MSRIRFQERFRAQLMSLALPPAAALASGLEVLANLARRSVHTAAMRARARGFSQVAAASEEVGFNNALQMLTTLPPAVITSGALNEAEWSGGVDASRFAALSKPRTVENLIQAVVARLEPASPG